MFAARSFPQAPEQIVMANQPTRFCGGIASTELGQTKPPEAIDFSGQALLSLVQSDPYQMYPYYQTTDDTTEQERCAERSGRGIASVGAEDPLSSQMWLKTVNDIREGNRRKINGNGEGAR